MVQALVMFYWSSYSHKFKRNLLVCFLIAVTLSVDAQVNEPASPAIYEYLYRMAQKGRIRWQDYQMPLQRTDIAAAIHELSQQQEYLSSIERSELRFYQQEYSFDSLGASSQIVLFKKDSSNRFRSARFDQNTSRIFIDPLIGVQWLGTNNGNAVHYYSGIKLAGYLGKNWGFNFSFRDNTEKGDTIVHRAPFSSKEGVIPTIQRDRLLNYSNFNFNIGYRWTNGSLSAGQENLSWGYGHGGNIILSGRAPSFPFIKFDLKPWPWMHFNYFHGWLQSNIIDSARTYNTGTGLFGGRREVYHPKFMAHHSITVTPVKGLDVSIGESIIYSDRLSFAYLVPINFFKIYDQYNSRYNINAGDNSQFFGMVSSRNHLKNTHLYAEFFIDEIRASKVFNRKESRNQIGYTFGINRTDLFIPYLTAGAEYSRINPFVYKNLIPAQTYESHNYSLGDWMGNNADRIYLFVKYVPFPRLMLSIWHQKLRKGAAGTLEQQYNQVPQPEFLFEKSFDYGETGFKSSYELFNKLTLQLEGNNIRTSPVSAAPAQQKAIRFGIHYGL